MTIFRHVFQQHLDKRNEVDEEDELLEEYEHPAEHLLPPDRDLAMSEPTLHEPPSPPETPELDALNLAAKLEEQPPEIEDPAPFVMSEEATGPATPPEFPDAFDDELALRAAEAHRLIEESQGAPQGAPASSPDLSGVAPTTPAPAAPPNRARTRLLGFGGAAADCVDPLGDLSDSPAEAKFPCGWLVIIDGPGRGESFALHPGVAQIGRNADQAISLDFGDRAISREQHAVVAYDPEAGKFYLGHGGKSNIIRLNDRPVLSTEEMGHGDTIRIGETVLRFVAFCDQSFAWGEGDS